MRIIPIVEFTDFYISSPTGGPLLCAIGFDPARHSGTIHAIQGNHVVTYSENYNNFTGSNN